MNRRELILGVGTLSLAATSMIEAADQKKTKDVRRRKNMQDRFKHNYLRLDDGVPLFYIDEGQGKPLVLIHNLMFGAD